MINNDRPANGQYVIKVKDHLDESRSHWFEDMTIVNGYDDEGAPITIMTGFIADQAALHGIMAKVRDMNLRLISVNQVEPDSPKSGPVSS